MDLILFWKLKKQKKTRREKAAKNLQENFEKWARRTFQMIGARDFWETKSEVDLLNILLFRKLINRFS